jgi:CRP-like cAMP-binding protein
MALRGELERHAMHAYLAGDLARALRVNVHLLKAAPTDYEARLRIADVLAAAGQKAEAARVYRSAARFDLLSGHPLPAVVAARALQALGESVDDLYTAIAMRYGRGSDMLDRHAPRLASPDPEEEVGVPSLVGLDGAQLLAARVDEAVTLATAEGALEGLPEQVRPVPLLSELTEESFRRVLGALTVQRLPDKQVVLREGEIGRSFFLVASGQVVVYNLDSLGHRTDLANLREGAVFGEMALLSASPRTASVEVVDDADLLELGLPALSTLAGEMQAVAAALDAFTRERLLRNVLAASPLFKPFSNKQQQDLLRRFTEHDCAPGTVLIREGDEARGLYVVLSGELEVVKKEGIVVLDLATLKPGDVCGEIAFVRGGKTTATVRAARQSAVLFLDRVYVERLVENVPELKALFETLSEERLSEMRAAMGEGPDGDSGSGLALDDDVLLF